MKALAILLFAIASACGGRLPPYGDGADKIGAVGQVPQEVKLAAAEILRRCDIPRAGRAIFFHWEGPSDAPPYTLGIPYELLEDSAVNACLVKEAKALGVEREIAFGDEPPPFKADR